MGAKITKEKVMKVFEMDRQEHDIAEIRKKTRLSEKKILEILAGKHSGVR